MAPLNFIVLPFVPQALFSKPTPQMNSFVMVLQYSAFILIIYGIFTIGSLLMIPFAFVKCLGTKFQLVMRANTITRKLTELFKVLRFTLFGIPLLLVGMFSDCYYFWANNFRSNLKQTIILREESTITTETIR